MLRVVIRSPVAFMATPDDDADQEVLAMSSSAAIAVSFSSASTNDTAVLKAMRSSGSLALAMVLNLCKAQEPNQRAPAQT
mmetsp:Transcript_117030/g.218879  ORF Transcript_117030/g.218879 Transcript_117030/m.218879 type:complete len:80 (+) Transcript_117030:416-655(+)